MDYKTTALKKEVETEELLIAEIPSLRFGETAQGETVFDYGAFFEENSMEPINYKAFMRLEKRNIETLAAHYGKATSELFYTTPSGKVLVSDILAVLFLGFASKELFGYFTDLVREALQNGVVCSNGMAYHLAAQRLPSDVLKEIIDSREATDEGNN